MDSKVNKKKGWSFRTYAAASESIDFSPKNPVLQFFDLPTCVCWIPIDLSDQVPTAAFSLRPSLRRSSDAKSWQVSCSAQEGLESPVRPLRQCRSQFSSKSDRSSHHATSFHTTQNRKHHGV